MNINFYSLFKIYIYLIFFFCFKDPEEYQSYEMVEPLENYFRPNMSLMIAVTMALDPNIDNPRYLIIIKSKLFIQSCLSISLKLFSLIIKEKEEKKIPLTMTLNVQF